MALQLLLSELPGLWKGWERTGSFRNKDTPRVPISKGNRRSVGDWGLVFSFFFFLLPFFSFPVITSVSWSFLLLLCYG